MVAGIPEMALVSIYFPSEIMPVPFLPQFLVFIIPACILILPPIFIYLGLRCVMQLVQPTCTAL